MEAASLAGELSATDVLEFTRTRAKGRRFRLVPKGHLTEANLAMIVTDLLRPFKPFPRRAPGNVMVAHDLVPAEKQPR